MIRAKYILTEVTVWLEQNGNVTVDKTGRDTATDEECISFALLIHSIRHKPIKGIDQVVADCLFLSQSQRQFRHRIQLALLPGHPDLLLS